jgi:hypothetical protein
MDIVLPSNLFTFLQWALKLGTMYNFVTVSCREPFYRKINGVIHHYLYPHLPQLKCHVSSPLAVINTGPKCKREEINQIMCGHYPEQTEQSEELKHRLMLLCDTWSLFVDAKDAANAWGQLEGGQSEGEGKRKRDRQVDVAHGRKCVLNIVVRISLNYPEIYKSE